MNKKNIFNEPMNAFRDINEGTPPNPDQLNLTVWVPQDYYIQFDIIINNHPMAGVTINVVPLSTNDLVTRLNVMIEANEQLPDLILLSDSTLVKIVEKNLSLFLKLEDYSLYIDGYSNFKLGELLQSNNEIYGIPFSGGPVAYYYNKDLFDNVEAMLADDMTWEEFFNECQKVMAEYNIPILPFPTKNDIYTMMKAQGLCFYDDAEIITADGCYEALSFFKRLYMEGLIDAVPAESEKERINAFLNGGVAGMMCPPYIIKMIEEQANETTCQNIGVIKLPKSEDFCYDVSLHGESWLMRNQRDDEKNLKFTEWMASIFSENTKNLYQALKLIPVDAVSIADCEKLEPEPYFDKNIIHFLALIGQDVSITLKGPKSDSCAELLYYKCQDVLLNGVSIDEVCENLEEEMNELPDSSESGDGGGIVAGGGGIIYKAELIVDKLPDKVVYEEGEFFSKAGMRVYFEVSLSQIEKPTRVEVTNYGIDKRTPLKKSDDTIYVSYVYRSVTYTAPVNIRVKPNSEKLKNKSGNTFGDFPKVNLFTGNISYESGDISIGANRNSISISHIYNTDAIRFYENRKTGVGNGWKLNIQQYIMCIDNVLYYIDSQGYMHEFKDNTIDGASNIYQDADGDGLTLYKEYTFGGKEHYYLLKDPGDNYILFDELGRMVRMIPAPCSWETLTEARAVVVEYENDKIKRVYDNQSENVSLYFEYSGAYIKQIKTNITENLTNNKEIEFIIDERGNLTSRKKGNIIEEYKYSLIGSLLKGVESKETKSAVEIFYKDDVKRVESYSVGYKDESDNFVEKSKNSFIYTCNADGLIVSTEVTNEKGFCVVYQFNTKGEIVSSFEKVNNCTFNTLQNETGKKITDFNFIPEINGMGTRKYSQGICTISGSIALCREGEKDTKNFAVTCYLSLLAENTSNLQAIIRYNYNNVVYTSGVKIDHTATGVWQKVCVPLTIPGAAEENAEISEFSFGIYDEQGASVGFEQSNILVRPNSTSATILTGGNKSLDLKNISAVEITDSDGDKKRLSVGKTVTVNGVDSIVHKVSLTYYDLLETSKSLYRNRLGGAEFYFEGGKNRYYDIKSVKLFSKDEEYSLMDLSSGKCNFILEQCAANNATKTKIQTTFRAEGVLTETTISTNEKSSTSKEFTTYDGRKIYEEDAYGVKTEYAYDKYFNLTQVKRVGKTFSGIAKEMIVSKAEYDSQGEYLTTSSFGYTSSAYTYNKPYESVIKETERSFNLSNQSYSNTSLNKNIVYDQNGRVSSVNLKNGETEVLRNDITYKDGKIRTVTDGSVKYGIKYDIANDEVSYTIFDGDIERDVQKHIQRYDETVKKTISTELYYRGEETDILTAVSDIYGRALSLGDGRNTVKYTYTDEFNGYDGADLIKTVFDPYENRTYTYNYDHDGKMCGWNTSDNTLAVRQIYGSETKYIFNGTEKYKTESVYDETIVNQPRLMGTKVYSDSDNNASDDWTEMTTYSCEYGYDEIGRINKKTVGEGVYDYTYLTTGKGDLLPNIQTIKYSFSRESNSSKWTYTHSYDNKGNLTTVTTNKTVGGLTSRVSSYTYDEANRMANETITEGGVKKLSKTYMYQSRGCGKLWEIKDNLEETKSKYFYYNNRGRIEYYSQNNKNYVYAYDNYGNVLSKKRDTGNIYQCVWERGNLLKDIVINGRTVKYEYNHQNVRFRKTTAGVVTNYYLDGSKILGEDRGTDKLRYFYDDDGLIGFSYNGIRYRYIKDGQENIVGIVNESGALMAQYEYDSFGSTTVKDSTGVVNTRSWFIGNVNPFRWKSFYYDAETGFYNANGRYYEIERGGYIDAIEADIIEGNAYDLLGLDRNGIMLLTLLMLAPYSATIATAMQLYADPTYNPNEGVEQEPESSKSWWKKHWKEVLLSSLNIVVGVVKLATGNPTGILNIVSGVIGLVGAIVSEQLAGAMGTAMLGVQTIMIGIQSLGCSLAYGLVAMAVGATCVAFATAEAQEGLGYGNWMKDAGMSDGWYSSLMVAANVAAIAVNIAGPKQCFKEGTLVETEAGLKPIEEIEVGDKVLAYDEATGEQAYKPVVRLFRNQTKEWYHVFANGEEMVCTSRHPFYVVGMGFILAKNLKANEKLLLSDGKEVIIEKIEVETLTKAETTYNFEVADFHTYYVSDCKVLVHNMCAGNKTNPEAPQKATEHQLKKAGIEPHEFKRSFLGKKSQISRYDIYVDKADDTLWLGTKTGKTNFWINTFTKLKR